MGIIEGTNICTKCNKEFKWHYLIAQKLSSNVVAVSIPDNSRGTKILRKIDEKKYLFSVRCPKCDCPLEFEQTVSEDIKHF